MFVVSTLQPQKRAVQCTTPSTWREVQPGRKQPPCACTQFIIKELAHLGPQGVPAAGCDAAAAARRDRRRLPALGPPAAAPLCRAATAWRAPAPRCPHHRRSTAQECECVIYKICSEAEQFENWLVQQYGGSPSPRQDCLCARPPLVVRIAIMELRNTREPL